MSTVDTYKVRIVANDVGGAGDASAANQVLTNAKLDSANTLLATLLTQTDFDTKAALLATAAKQDTGNTSLSTLATNLPAKGAAAAAASLPVTLANDGVFATNFGLQADAAAGTDTAAASFIALFKRLLQKFTSQLPAALGQSTKANSLTVAPASDWGVQGDVAAAATDSGNPVKVGGKYNSAKPTYTNGQRGDFQIEINGGQTVALYGKVTNPGDTPMLLSTAGRSTNYITTTPTDGRTNQVNDPADATDTQRASSSYQWAFNGATWDRIRIATKYVSLSAVTIDTIATVLTPTTGKKFRLLGGTLSASTAISVLFEDNTAGAGNFIFRTPKLLVDTPYNFTTIGNGILSAAANNLLKATGSAAGNITGTLYYVEE